MKQQKLFNRLGNFTIVDNGFIMGANLSLQAIGLYTFMCSKPPAWVFTYAGLSSQLEESTKTLKKLVKELVVKGALVRHRTTGATTDGHKYPTYDWVLNPSREDIDKGKTEDPILSVKNGDPQNGDPQNGDPQNGDPQNGGDIVITNPSNTKRSKKEMSKAVVAHLNGKINSKYKDNNKFIKKLIDNGYEVRELIGVIDKKYREWWGGDNEQYIRPSTLFGDKFEEYLNSETKEDRIKTAVFIQKLLGKVEMVLSYLQENTINSNTLSNLKMGNKSIFSPKDLEILQSFPTPTHIVSLYKQGELEQEIKKRLKYVQF